MNTMSFLSVKCKIHKHRTRLPLGPGRSCCRSAGLCSQCELSIWRRAGRLGRWWRTGRAKQKEDPGVSENKKAGQAWNLAKRVITIATHLSKPKVVIETNLRREVRRFLVAFTRGAFRYGGGGSMWTVVFPAHADVRLFRRDMRLNLTPVHLKRLATMRSI